MIDTFSGCTLWGSWDDQYGCPPLPEEEEDETADADGIRTADADGIRTIYTPYSISEQSERSII